MVKSCNTCSLIRFIMMTVFASLSQLCWLFFVLETKASETYIQLSNITVFGKSLSSNITFTKTQIGFVQCGNECYSRRDCLSFNYDWGEYSCDLNHENESTKPLTNNHTASYTDKDNLPQNLVRGCSGVTCPVHSKCVQLTNGRTKCISIIPDKPEIASCGDIKQCNSNYGDGEYWIWPMGNNYTKTKVYCHDMLNNPTEYITLYNPNESILNLSRLSSSNPCAWNPGIVTRSYFRKIRIDVTSMTVIRNDKTFADLTEDSSGQWNTPAFANGMGCAINPYQCTKIGYLLIDTTNTGLIVDPSINFIAGGYNPYMGTVTRSADNYRIEARCDGACGSCFPDGDLVLINSSDEVPQDSAVIALCE